MPDKIHTMTFSVEPAHELRELTRRAGLPSPRYTVARALALLDVCLEKNAAGYEVVFRHPDGDTEILNPDGLNGPVPTESDLPDHL